MPLVLEIEYLSGVVFSSRGPESSAPDWPPQPDRVFSALVATWGARGKRAEEAEALKWLEQQPVPKIVASSAQSRTAPVSFVPPNDQTVLPHMRGRQPRRFPAAHPISPTVCLCWQGVAPDAEVFQALTGLAEDTSYVGHSASLTRCRFLQSEAPPVEAVLPHRRIYPGRFDELCRDYARFLASRGKTGRPHAGELVRDEAEPQSAIVQSCFDSKWLVLEHTGREMPDIRASALVAKEIRDTILSGYKNIGKGDSVPSTVSGHELSGSPTKEPHLAIVPLAFAGYDFADGHVLGFALVPPRGSKLLENSDFLRALKQVAPVVKTTERRAMELRLRHFGLNLSPTLEPDKRSLDPRPYCRPSTIFATLTPIVLDRHLKKTNEEKEQEIVDQITAACKNIGLHEPMKVVPDKHSAIEGAPSARPSGRSPRWTRWRLPSSLSSRFLTHAVIQFAEPVAGPVILGAGRFVGLGLCRPLDTENMA